MFVRTKVLKDYPVFSTPPIKLWSTQLKGHTGQNENGFYEDILGNTGCDAVPGIDSSKVIYESDYFAEIPGDQVAYFADYEEGETPDQITVVSGAVVLPTKYEGIPFDNTIIGEDGKLYYQYVNGELPKSVIPFVKSDFYPDVDDEVFPKYARVEPFNLRTTGMTAGDNYEKNVVLFPVFYSDDLNNSITNSKINILFSLEAPVTVQEGVWRPDNTISRCSPCRINWPPGQRNSYLCYEGTLDVCDGVPYAYFQTLPETVNVLTLNLAICQTEEQTPIISVTDTSGFVNQFQYQKVLTTGYKNDCFNGEFPESCFDDTITTKVCGTFSSRQEWTICNPLYGLNRGFSRQFESCSKLPLMPCEPGPGPCDGVNCEAQCPSKIYTVVYKYTESIQECFLPPDCPRYYRRDVGGLIPNYQIFDMSNPSQVAMYQAFRANCGQPQFPCTDACSGCSTTRCKEYTLNVPGCNATPTTVKIEVVAISEGTVDAFTCEGYGSSDDSYELEVGMPSSCPSFFTDETCSCCCFVDRNGNPVPRCEDRFPMDNLAFIKLKDTTEYKPNPFLIYHTNSAYAYELNGRITFNFALYIDDYFKTFATYAQPLFDPAIIIGYKSLFKNPSCSNSNDYPEYFFSNIEEEKVGITVGYNPEVCAGTYKTLPNPVVACDDLFKLRRRAANGFNCSLNRKHSPEKLKNYSFELACLEYINNEAIYTEDERWLRLKDWPMQIIDYYGACNGEGITLPIQMPIGLTLNDCTNILSWDFLKNAPK
jgi:hypothetical protein